MTNIPTMSESDLGIEDPEHGSHFSVGTTRSTGEGRPRWTIDPDHWWFRDARIREDLLIANSKDGLYVEGRIFVRSLTHARLIDAQLRLK